MTPSLPLCYQIFPLTARRAGVSGGVRFGIRVTEVRERPVTMDVCLYLTDKSERM